jgi:hypothetical protein
MPARRTGAILTLTAVATALGLVSCNDDRLKRALNAENPKPSQATTSDVQDNSGPTDGLAVSPDAANPQYD